MKPKRTSGFTLVELMVAVVIIGLLASMAAPTFISIKRRSLNFRFMNDVRIFKDAVQSAYLESGVLPGAAAAGTLDPMLDGYISATQFSQRTPIGGNWHVQVDDGNIWLGVGAVGYTATGSDLNSIDSRFDDGDLGAGSLRTISGGFYFVVE